MKQIIRIGASGPVIMADPWQIVHGGEPLPVGVPLLIPLPRWLQLRTENALLDQASIGVWIASDNDYEAVAAELVALPLIAVDFPSFRDGRGYSIAYLLRSRHGYQGELRAMGDVLRDQLFYMQRCGFDSFEVRAGKDIHDALLGLTAYTVRYQGAVDDPVPLFRKRTAQSEQDDEHWEP